MVVHPCGWLYIYIYIWSVDSILCNIVLYWMGFTIYQCAKLYVCKRMVVMMYFAFDWKLQTDEIFNFILTIDAYMHQMPDFIGLDKIWYCSDNVCLLGIKPMCKPMMTYPHKHLLPTKVRLISEVWRYTMTISSKHCTIKCPFHTGQI